MVAAGAKGGAEEEVPSNFAGAHFTAMREEPVRRESGGKVDG